MQRVTQEMNLPEITFLRREGVALELCCCTSKVEVDLCGHTN